MDRTNIINHLIKKKDNPKYLEIGVEQGLNFNQIKCLEKTGVDPDPNSFSATNNQTSDEFFETNDKTFDIIFIDGLHHADQLKKDIINSLKVLNDKRTIICHDVNPPSELIQKRHRSQYLVWRLLESLG
jgi:predicted O-methyltransferase YrrM